MFPLKASISLCLLGLLAVTPFGEPVDKYLGNRGEGNLDKSPPTTRGSTDLLRRSTYPYPGYENCVDRIQEVAADKPTFYSELGFYPNQIGYRFIHDFIESRGLLEVDSVYPTKFCRPHPDLTGGCSAYISFAYSFSGLFAQLSSGTAYVLVPSECDPSPDSIWNTVELGNLTTNHNGA